MVGARYAPDGTTPQKGNGRYHPRPVAPAPPDRLLRLFSAIGAVIWPLWWVLGGSAAGASGEIGFALVGGIALVVPLGLLLTREPDRNGVDVLSFRGALWAWPVAAPLALLALLGAPGALSSGLAMPWMVCTGLVGAFGARRLARRSHFDLAETCLDAGLIYLPVGAVWLIVSRAGTTLLGFGEPWTSLTAAHFHFAGFGVPLLAGLVGRALPSLTDAAGNEPFGVRAAWRVSAWFAVIGPPLTALGIATSRWLELAGATVMLVGAVGTGAMLLVLAIGSSLPPRARRLLGVAGVIPVATSALAFIWAASNFLGSPFPSIPRMVRYHGIGNAVGFVALALVGFALARLPQAGRVPGVPFSRMRAGVQVGRWFFRSQGLVCADVDPPLGLVSDMEVYRRSGIPGLHDFDPTELHPSVRDFYEQTSAFSLSAICHWSAPFSWLAPLVRGVARGVGQLELPQGESSSAAMDSSLLPLRGDLDGRGAVTGWVRLHAGTERPVYVAAYATHRHQGVPYMNIAMPLPGANMSSILRADPGTLGGLVLTTTRRRGFAGDEGIYLVTRFGELRLPMQETLILGPAAGRADGDLAASHEVHFLGMKVLTLTYLIVPRDTTAGA